MLPFSFHVLQDKQTTTNCSYHWSFQEKQDQMPLHTKQAQLKKKKTKTTPTNAKVSKLYHWGKGVGRWLKGFPFYSLFFYIYPPNYMQLNQLPMGIRPFTEKM